MPVLHTGDKKILFIHVPKTGGTFVETLLDSYGSVSGVKYGLEDLPNLPCTIQHFHGPMLEHIHSVDRWEVVSDFDYVFMMVRHPLDRLLSEYRYRNRGAFETTRMAQGKWQEHLDVWCQDAMEQYKWDQFHLDNHVRPQHEFEAFDPEIFRFEDGFTEIKKNLDHVTGVVGQLPDEAINSSNKLTAELTPSDQVIRLAETLYAEDYERYGYDKYNV